MQHTEYRPRPISRFLMRYEMVIAGVIYLGCVVVMAYWLWTAPLSDDLEPNEVSLWKSLREKDNG